MSNITDNKTMQELMDEEPSNLIPIKEKSLVEVSIVAKSRTKIWVDVKGLVIGFVPEKEFSQDVYDLKVGDKILAYVLCVENDDGYTVLSLKRADKERLTTNLEEKFKQQEIVSVRVKQANRGGLIVEFGSIEGFLPASQLSSSHYPKVGDDKDKILGKLNELVGHNLKVKIINYDQQSNKLIFSEKAAGDQVLEDKIKEFKVGLQLEGVVTGIVDFGIFVDIGNVEGLVHISEVSWDKVSNLREKFHVGDKVTVEVISLEGGRVSLSIKRLIPDPWLNQIKNLQPKQEISGRVAKITPFGIFVELVDQAKGLVHISELSEELKNSATGKLEEIFTLGKEYNFVINNIDPENHKINLTLAKNEIAKSEKKSSKKEKVDKTVKEGKTPKKKTSNKKASKK